jgi:hypothetical protein
MGTLYKNQMQGIWVHEGVDPSKIDYAWLKNQGVEFVVVRAGDNFTADSKFQDHVQGAYNADLPIGLTWRDNPDWPSGTLVMNLESARNMRYDQDQQIEVAYNATVKSPKAFSFGFLVMDRKFIDEETKQKPVSPAWARDIPRMSRKHLAQAWTPRITGIASTDAYAEWCKDPASGAAIYDWVNQDGVYVCGLNLISGWFPSGWANALDIPDTEKPNGINAASGKLKWWRYAFGMMPINSAGDVAPVGLVLCFTTTRQGLYDLVGYVPHTTDPDNPPPVDPGTTTVIEPKTLYEFMDQAADLIIQEWDKIL